jgi:23S rRNA pseudouridine2605 synthase
MARRDDLDPEELQTGEAADAEATDSGKYAEARHEERLQKIIASAGITSRRKAEELITEGRVQVNGQTVTELGSKADATRDHIRVDGKLLKGEEKHRYFMLNKPKGFVTTVSDPEKRPTVMQFFKQSKARVFPVGRLDYQSEGLLLMTNDGDLANLLTRASSKVDKTYLVKVSRKPSENAIDQLRAGIMIDRGRPDFGRDSRPGSGGRRVLTQPAAIRLIRDAENPWYEVTLTEGRNRQIRKLFEEIGHFVEKIRRVGYGPLVLDIAPGEIRELTSEEVLALQRAARGIPRTSAAKARTVSAAVRGAGPTKGSAERHGQRSTVGKAAIKRAIGPAKGPNASRTRSGATRGPVRRSTRQP